LKRAGATIVLGHHPHCTQGWEEGVGGLSFYSLGDFVFDKTEAGRDEALVARIPLSRPSEASVVSTVRGADLVVRQPGDEREETIGARLALLNQALTSGVSDDRYLQLFARRRGSILQSLRRDLRIGGIGAVIARIRRAAPRRAATVLRASTTRIFKRRAANDSEPVLRRP
jgi:poly-gamma-glutamate synthesis protein (capsule biosynthesis protein)